MKKTRGGMNRGISIIAVFTLSFLMVISGTFSFEVPKAFAVVCPCTPNLAVYPKGNDPRCVNGMYNLPNATSCSDTGGSISNAPIKCSVVRLSTFKDLIMNLVIGCIIQPSFRILVGLAVVSFLWGVFKFIRSEGDDKQSGREFILYGILGLFVMLSLLGLVNILSSTFRTNNSYDITPRQVNTSAFQ